MYMGAVGTLGVASSVKGPGNYDNLGIDNDELTGAGAGAAGGGGEGGGGDGGIVDYFMNLLD